MQLALLNEYVVSTRIRAARNIAGFALPPGATVEDRAGVERVCARVYGVRVCVCMQVKLILFKYLSTHTHQTTMP